MSEEIWRVITEFPNYEVSNLGNVRNKEGRVLKPCFDTDGYRQILLYRKDGLGWRGTGRYTFKVYRLVLETFNGKDPDDRQIDHINRIRTDDRLENLRWVTCRENNLNRGTPIEMTGINWNTKNSTYVVRVYVGEGKKQLYIGCRKELEEAKRLRDDYYANKANYDRNTGKVEAREMRGISFNDKTKTYSVRVRQGKNEGQRHLGTCKDLEEAKRLRDNYYLNNNENN